MIKTLFTEIARRYDRMNHVLSLRQDIRWRRRAAGLVVGRPTTVLDLACGTGDFSFALARRFPNANILGIDLTPAMLEIARRKNTSARISFAEANAENLEPREDHGLRVEGWGLKVERSEKLWNDSTPSVNLQPQPPTFDLVSCAFGFRNFPDKAAALSEAKRVLAPDGSLLVLEFFRPQSRILGWLTDLWLRGIASVFARSNASAYAYLRDSMKRTICERAFVDLARERGFALVARRFYFPCCTCLLFESDK